MLFLLSAIKRKALMIVHSREHVPVILLVLSSGSGPGSFWLSRAFGFRFFGALDSLPPLRQTSPTPLCPHTRSSALSNAAVEAVTGPVME